MEGSVDEDERAALCAAAILHFGVTSVPTECGYILPDGTMLDLSGRHHDGSYVRRGDRNVPKRGPDYFAGTRLTDHRELGDLVEGGGSEGMMRFLRLSGAIRVMPESGFTLVTPPTARQVALMCAFADHYRTGVFTEIYDDDCQVLAIRFHKRLTVKAAVGFLRENGLMPVPGDPPGPAGP